MAIPITLQHGDHVVAAEVSSFLSPVLLAIEITGRAELHKYYFMETQCEAENGFPLAPT